MVRYYPKRLINYWQHSPYRWHTLVTSRVSNPQFEIYRYTIYGDKWFNLGKNVHWLSAWRHIYYFSSASDRLLLKVIISKSNVLHFLWLSSFLKRVTPEWLSMCCFAHVALFFMNLMPNSSCKNFRYINPWQVWVATIYITSFVRRTISRCSFKSASIIASRIDLICFLINWNPL